MRNFITEMCEALDSEVKNVELIKSADGNSLDVVYELVPVPRQINISMIISRDGSIDSLTVERAAS